MFASSITKAMLLFSLGAVAFAWMKGGPPERSGSLLMVSISIGMTVFQFLTKSAFGPLPILIGDGIIATGFLLLAVRYASLWLAAAMILQAGAFILHAAVIMGVVPERDYYYYYAAMNLATFLVIVAIIIGTATAWLHRRRLARQAPFTPPA